MKAIFESVNERSHIKAEIHNIKQDFNSLKRLTEMCKETGGHDEEKMEVYFNNKAWDILDRLQKLQALCEKYSALHLETFLRFKDKVEKYLGYNFLLETIKNPFKN